MRALMTFALVLTACAAGGGPALATAYVFTATLNGANEAPPNASPGFGSSTLYLDTGLHTMRVLAAFQDLVGVTTASHIHAATAVPETGTAPVATELPTFTGFPLGVTSGTYDHTFDTSLNATWNPIFLAGNGGTAAGAEAAFLNALLQQRAYINIHSTVAPGGEIRDFYSAAVPEPATWALMIAGFGLAGAQLRQRRSRETPATA